ncbi:unnamed protein product, partial [Symbiodinium pilosum]
EAIVEVAPLEVLRPAAKPAQDEQAALAAVIKEEATVVDKAPAVAEEVEAPVPAPPAAPEEEHKAVVNNRFTVALEAEGDIGLVLDDLSEQGPVVADIQKGLVQDMGLQSPDLALRQYDCITAVNDVEGDVGYMCELLEAPTKARTVLKVLRPTEMHISFKKSGEEPLGIHMNFKTSSAGIVLEQIKEGGQFDRHLASLPEDARLRPGDRIIAINALRLRGTELVETLKK